MKKHLFLLVALVFSFVAYAAEYTPATVPDPKVAGQENYVANPDSILEPQIVNDINMLAVYLEDKTDVELCIVALQSIGDADAFDFSYELFQRWGIGKAGKNTGVLFLFVLDSHDIQIRTGTGIEGVLTDAKCSEIYRSMVPFFRQGAYGIGLRQGAVEVCEICLDGDVPEELQNMKSVTNRGKYADGGGDDAEEDRPWYMSPFTWVLGGAGLIFFILAWFATHPKCPMCKKRKTKEIHSEVIIAATYTRKGEKRVTYLCKNCGHTWKVMEDIPKLTPPGSSSSSSYGDSDSSGGSWGGGSTSGGGAGGKW